MTSNLNPIPLVKSFPCLMEYRLQGSHLVGIYLVAEIDNSDPDYNYSVCLISPTDNISNIGEMYYKKELNPEEWFFLPEGTTVNLIN